MKLKNLIGQRFGRYIVLGRALNDRNNAVRWNCRCDCGVVNAVYGNALRAGTSKGCVTCGVQTHGHASGKTMTPEYKSWAGMRNRCLNPHYFRFEDYGGRGITISPEWNSFETFLNDMGPRPPGMSLERENNNKGYSRINCKWATPLEQANNKRRYKNSKDIYDART